MTELCPQGYTDHEACFAPFRYCPVKGCGRAERVEACGAERELGAKAYTLACIRRPGHDGLHRDPLSNVEWSEDPDARDYEAGYRQSVIDNA